MAWHCRSLDSLSLSFSRLSVTTFTIMHTAVAASLMPGTGQLRASSCAAANAAWPRPMSPDGLRRSTAKEAPLSPETSLGVVFLAARRRRCSTASATRAAPTTAETTPATMGVESEVERCSDGTPKHRRAVGEGVVAASEVAGEVAVAVGESAAEPLSSR